MRIFLLHFILFTLLLTGQSTYAQNSSTLLNQAKVALEEGKNSKAIKKFENALARAESEKNNANQMTCHLNLAELKDNVFNYKEALSHYESFSKLYKIQASKENQILEESVIGLEESVTGLAAEVEEGAVKIEEKNKAIDILTTEQLEAKLAILDLKLDNQNKQLEIKESENRRNILMLVLGMFTLITAFIFIGYFQKRRANKSLESKNYQIGKEKEKSEKLLLNILPKIVADELKEHGKTTPSRYEMATVMFTDFKGFTKFSEENSPENLVSIIDYYFSEFDNIMVRHNIEKIKTIGDAYLCVSGIPEYNPNHVSNMINAAFEVQRFVNQTIQDQKAIGRDYLDLRIGIHCGPLVAGVVGDRKFAYDVWGDTVNVAARMEQSGEVNVINVSEAVYNLAKDEFDFHYRGEIEAKNKGKLKMYFVDKLKEAGEDVSDRLSLNEERVATILPSSQIVTE